MPRKSASSQEFISPGLWSAWTLGDRSKYLSAWALPVWWLWKLQNTGLRWCHRHRACPWCCCIWPASWFLQSCGWDVLWLLQAACRTSDTSGNQALGGIPNGLSLQAAGEASDSSSCMERPGPSPASLSSECQVSLAEGKSHVFSGWAVPEQLLKYLHFFFRPRVYLFTSLSVTRWGWRALTVSPRVLWR